MYQYGMRKRNEAGRFVGFGIGMFVVAILANLALLAGAVWVVVWVLKRTGVI